MGYYLQPILTDILYLRT